MSNNSWMPEHLREDWDNAKREANEHRDEVNNTPADWTDDQHDVFADVVAEAQRKTKYGGRLTEEERKALKEYLKDTGGWYNRVKQDIANRREQATPDVRSDGEGGWVDKYGRPCNINGERY